MASVISAHSDGTSERAPGPRVPQRGLHRPDERGQPEQTDECGQPEQTDRGAPIRIPEIRMEWVQCPYGMRDACRRLDA